MAEYTKRQSTPMIRAYERAMRITDQNESILQKNTLSRGFSNNK